MYDYPTRTYPQLLLPPHAPLGHVRQEADVILDKTEHEIKTRSDLAFPDWVRMAAQAIGATIRGDNARDLVRQGLSNWSIAAAFANIVGQYFSDGYRDQPDTLALLYDVAPVQNYLPQLALSQYEGGRLRQQGTGEAADLFLGLRGQTWAIDRYSAVVNIDEKDLIDAAPTNLRLTASREMGRAAKRCILDLAWSLLLSNPTMPDGKACFCEDHGNLASGGASALSESSLDAGLEALGNQVFRDDDGAPIHVNGEGKIVITAPKTFGLARRLSRWMQLGDSGDIEVRSESRLSASIGVADPRNETSLIVSPSDSAWLLAAPAKTITCIVIGALDGRLEPELRTEFFGAEHQPPTGRWGITMDCKVDVGAVLVNHRGLYFSAGA